jgi:hypothetical protein
MRNFCLQSFLYKSVRFQLQDSSAFYVAIMRVVRQNSIIHWQTFSDHTPLSGQDPQIMQHTLLHSINAALIIGRVA